MTSTYNRQTQPIINWKELATYSAVPSWNYNGNNTSGNNGTSFKEDSVRLEIKEQFSIQAKGKNQGRLSARQLQARSKQPDPTDLH